MRQAHKSRQPENRTLTRRGMMHVMISGLAATGTGLAVASLLPSLAIADQDNKKSDTSMVAEIFFDSFGPTALQRALRYAGTNGFVASLPELLHARATAPYDNIIWNTWFTANSEENVVTTAQGNHVVVVVHGGGIFARPARFEHSLRADLARSNTAGLTGQYAARISGREATDLLAGRLPDSTIMPIYPFEEFKRDIAELPRRYGVTIDFDTARSGASGYEDFDALRRDPNMIIRAGGVAPLIAYLDRAKARNSTKSMGTWHPYNRIDPDQPQTRILELGGNKGGRGSDGNDQGLGWGYDTDYGITGNGAMTDMARYVAVAPRIIATSLQHLDFEI